MRGGSLLTAALLAVAFPAAASTPMEQLVAPPLYEDLLAGYLRRVPGDGAGFTTRFDYAGFHAQPDQVQLRAALRETFLAVEPGGLDELSRTAWAINAYNFLVIDAVIEHYRPDLESVADIGGEESFAVFESPRIPVSGIPLSLNEFEERFLFLGFDRESGSPPEGLDPRLHFAVVCAARGCPPLMPGPYTGADLDRMLDEAVANALLSPGQLRIEGDTLHVSKLFEWYAPDFDPPGAAAFLGRYVPGIDSGTAVVAADIPWDWSLNAP